MVLLPYLEERVQRMVGPDEPIGGPEQSVERLEILRANPPNVVANLSQESTVQLHKLGQLFELE